MSGEDSWVFDSLICFLHGPVWNAALQTFIDENSMVFDPNQQADEHNTAVLEIYTEYKNLVDCMLGSYMEEMQITPEQFELACMESRQQQEENTFSLHQGLLQQIWAANDINVFARMMTQRNTELQLQALDLIEKNQLVQLQEGEQVEHANSTNEDERSGKISSRTNSPHFEEFVSQSIESKLDHHGVDVTKEGEVLDADKVMDKFQRLNLFFEKNPEVNPEDVQSRQEYLRQQRAKILEIKRNTRTKQLLETMARGDSSCPTEGDKILAMTGLVARPSSALLAQQLLESGEVVKSSGSDDQGNNAALQLRKTLAKRLKSEVVERKSSSTASCDHLQ